MKAVKKIMLIVICSYLIIKLSSTFIDRGFKNYFTSFFKKMDHVFKSDENDDIIYVGNSRANFGINPYFIDSICKTKSYNLGLGGSDISAVLMFLRSYLIHHHPPAYLVYSYDYRLFQSTRTLEVAPVFFYYAQYQPIRDELNRYNYHENFLQFFPDLKYSFFNDYYRTCAVKGLSGHTMNDPAKQKNIATYLYDYNGFVNYQTSGLNITEADSSLPKIMPEFRQLFDTLLHICNANKIKMIFIYPPEWHLKNNIESKELIKKKMFIDSTIAAVCKTNNFYSTRFDADSSFIQQDFTDANHVNIYGARKYSILLGNYLKSIIQ